MPCGIRMTHGTYLNRWSITAWHPKYSKCSWWCLNPCKPADAHPLILDDWRDNGSWLTTGVAGTCWESEKKTTKQNINQLPVLTSPAAISCQATQSLPPLDPGPQNPNGLEKRPTKNLEGQFPTKTTKCIQRCTKTVTDEVIGRPGHMKPISISDIRCIPCFPSCMTRTLWGRYNLSVNKCIYIYYNLYVYIYITMYVYIYINYIYIYIYVCVKKIRKCIYI